MKITVIPAKCFFPSFEKNKKVFFEVNNLLVTNLGTISLLRHVPEPTAQRCFQLINLTENVRKRKQGHHFQTATIVQKENENGKKRLRNRANKSIRIAHLSNFAPPGPAARQPIRRLAVVPPGDGPLTRFRGQ